MRESITCWTIRDRLIVFLSTQSACVGVSVIVFFTAGIRYG